MYPGKLALVTCEYLKRVNDTISFFMIGYNNTIVKLQNYLEYFTKPFLKSLTKTIVLRRIMLNNIKKMWINRAKVVKKVRAFVFFRY